MTDKINCYLIYYTRELQSVYTGDNSKAEAEGIAVVFANSPSSAADALRHELGIENNYWNGILSMEGMDALGPPVRLIADLDDFNTGRGPIDAVTGVGFPQPTNIYHYSSEDGEYIGRDGEGKIYWEPI